MWILVPEKVISGHARFVEAKPEIISILAPVANVPYIHGSGIAIPEPDIELLSKGWEDE